VGCSYTVSPEHDSLCQHLISSCLSTKGLVKVFSKVILKVKSTRLILYSAQEFKN